MTDAIITILMNTGLFLGALLIMEGVAWIAHKYVMHGWLWSLHKSHHQPDPNSFFELNDWFAFFFSLPSILLIYLGVHYWPPLLWIGIGIAGYGLIYFLFHDVIVHRRVKLPLGHPKGYLAHIIEAHVIHHHVTEQHGAVSYGFLFAPSLEHLRAKLKASKAERSGQI